MYALFEGERQIGSPFPTDEGLVSDVPVADGKVGQIMPSGYHVQWVEQTCEPARDWNARRASLGSHVPPPVCYGCPDPPDAPYTWPVAKLASAAAS
jgi:hypothetical protein